MRGEGKRVCVSLAQTEARDLYYEKMREREMRKANGKVALKELH